MELPLSLQNALGGEGARGPAQFTARVSALPRFGLDGELEDDSGGGGMSRACGFPPRF